MAPRMTGNSRAPAKPMPKPFASDHTTGHKEFKNSPSPIQHRTNACIDSASPPQKQTKVVVEGSALSSSGGDEDEADSGNSDNTEGDEEASDDKAGDGLAPSGSPMELHGDQAGPINVKSVNYEVVAAKASATKLESDSQHLEQTASLDPKPDIQEEEIDSDDDVYNGVDLISNSDGEDSDVMKAEERNIIESTETDDMHSLPATIPTSATGPFDDWEGFDLDHGLFATDISFFEEQFGRTEPSVLESETELFRSTSVFDDFDPQPPLPQSPPKIPRVRFKLPVTILSEDSDIVSDDEDIHGLFNSAAAQTSEEKSVGGLIINDEDDGSSVGSSSGYETDYGDTTDEEDVPASATTRPQSLLRQPPFSSLDNGNLATPSAAPNPFRVPTAPARRFRGPHMGVWSVSRTTSFATVDSTGDNMVVVPARRPNVSAPSRSTYNGRPSTAITSPMTAQPALSALDDSGVDYSDFLSQVDADPMLASEPDVMPSNLLPTAPNSQVHDQAIAPPSIFFPMDDMGDVSAVYTLDGQDDNDDEHLLRVEDFIDFGVSSDDEAEEVEESMDPSLPTPMSTSPSGTGACLQSTTPLHDSPTTPALLRHLDKGVIGAFRRGSSRHQVHSPRPQSKIPLNSHAFNGGRQAAAHSPSCPPKKRKLSDSFNGRGALGATTKRRLIHHR